MICIVTGSLRDLRGRPIADGRISFERDGVRGQDGSVVVPKLVEVTADAYGVFSVGLYPGLYAATIRDGVRGSERFAVGVPDAPTADLADLVAQMPELTPTVLAQVLAARDEVLAAAAGGVGGPAETGDTLVAKLVALGGDARLPHTAVQGLGSAATADTEAFATTSHDHDISAITGLQGALDALASQIGDIDAALDAINGEVI